MLYRAKITSKGQITIPTEVRRALGLDVGDWLAFETQADYALVSREKSLREVSEKLRARTAGRTSRYESEDEAIAVAISEDLVAEDHSAGLLLIRVSPDDIK